jgi:dolichol kinase
MNFFFSDELLVFIRANSNALLDEIMLLITGYGPFFVFGGMIIFLFIKKKFKEIFLLFFAVLASLEIVYLIKKIIQIPRPSIVEIYNIAYLTYSNGFSFPSLHAAFGFAFIPICLIIFKNFWIRLLLIIFLVLIAVSRIYLAVHFIEDVIAGAAIGLSVSYLIIILDKKLLLYEKFIYHFLTKLEFRRQVAHLFTGLAIILLVKLNLINVMILLAVLIIGGFISLISRKYQIPIVHQVLTFFERPDEIKRFPGKGSFYLVLGALLSLFLFEQQVALAAIAIMAIGDSFTSLVGIYFGQFSNPFNPAKNIEGTIFAILAATLGAFNFVEFNQALLGSVGGMIFESITKAKINRVIDDNLLIPLIAGFIMS